MSTLATRMDENIKQDYQLSGELILSGFNTSTPEYLLETYFKPMYCRRELLPTCNVASYPVPISTSFQSGSENGNRKWARSCMIATG